MEHKIFTKKQLFIIYTNYNSITNKYRYKNPPQAYKLIKINPGSIEYWSDKVSSSRGLAQTRLGDWDNKKNLQSVDDRWMVKGLKQRFGGGEDWRNTRYISYVTELFDERDAVFNCSTVEEVIDTRCRYLDDLFHDIKKNGYRSEMGEDSDKNNKFRYYGSNFKQNLDLMVLIGRGGEIIMKDGFHRFAIADVLDLEIPALVLCRHHEWQLLRDKVSKAAASKDLSEKMRPKSDHPDLQDCISITG